MTKLEYIARCLARAQNKRYEHYVVSRIWHRLDDVTLKFVTQQYVTRPEGRALTDMYFPQLELHVEVDEGFHKKQLQADALREADIINATGHEIMRVDVTKNMEEVHRSIEDVVARVRWKKAALLNFKPWDAEAETNPQTYIEKGYIDVGDDVAFNTMVDAANCFGNHYKPKAIWTGGAKHPNEPGKVIWFPKLYQNGEWDNQISGDDAVITERNLDAVAARLHINKVLQEKIYSRIVFARVKSPLGDIRYRFKGEYALDVNASNNTTGLIWKRVAQQVRTYPQPVNVTS